MACLKVNQSVNAWPCAKDDPLLACTCSNASFLLKSIGSPHLQLQSLAWQVLHLEIKCSKHQVKGLVESWTTDFEVPLQCATNLIPVDQWGMSISNAGLHSRHWSIELEPMNVWFCQHSTKQDCVKPKLQNHCQKNSWNNFTYFKQPRHEPLLSCVCPNTPDSHNWYKIALQIINQLQACRMNWIWCHTAANTF